VPAPKQASAPATIKIDLSGERRWLSVDRSADVLLPALVNPRAEVAAGSARGDLAPEPAVGVAQPSASVADVAAKSDEAKPTSG
jgi:hypothetical protein